jgi:hypothetical protein
LSCYKIYDFEDQRICFTLTRAVVGGLNSDLPFKSFYLVIYGQVMEFIYPPLSLVTYKLDPSESDFRMKFPVHSVMRRSTDYFRNLLNGVVGCLTTTVRPSLAKTQVLS